MSPCLDEPGLARPPGTTGRVGRGRGWRGVEGGEMERVSGRRKRHNFPSKKKIQEIDLQLTGWLRTHRGLIIFSIKKKRLEDSVVQK